MSQWVANSNNCLGQRKLIIRGYATSIQESYCNAYTKKGWIFSRSSQNYRPVANLNFVGKVIEKVATMQIVEYLSNNNLHVPTQSAYKQHHSVETALTRVQNDVILSLDQREEALLVLLDFTSAFDTIDHDIMLTLVCEAVRIRWMCPKLAEVISVWSIPCS